MVELGSPYRRRSEVNSGCRGRRRARPAPGWAVEVEGRAGLGGKGLGGKGRGPRRVRCCVQGATPCRRPRGIAIHVRQRIQRFTPARPSARASCCGHTGRRPHLILPSGHAAHRPHRAGGSWPYPTCGSRAGRLKRARRGAGRGGAGLRPTADCQKGTRVVGLLLLGRLADGPEMQQMTAYCAKNS